MTYQPPEPKYPTIQQPANKVYGLTEDPYATYVRYRDQTPITDVVHHKAPEPKPVVQPEPVVEPEP